MSKMVTYFYMINNLYKSLLIKALCFTVSVSGFAQSISVTNSWIANDGGTQGSHIMHNIDNMFVRADGTSYCITYWDEGTSNVSVFKDGKLISVPENSGTGGWGRMSGTAITADSNYIYQIQSQHGCDGANTNMNQNNLPQYPKCNVEVWKWIARYYQNGTLAPFSQGYGFKGAHLLISPNGTTPNGIAVYNNELFVSDPTGDTIKVYNTKNLTTKPIRKFYIPRVGLLSPDNKGSVWMLQKATDLLPAKIIRFTITGVIQSQEIILPAGVSPSSFSVDVIKNQILVADISENQNVIIYNNIYTTPTISGSFGTKKGIHSGIPGEVAPLKFNKPMGVGTDAAGNIYVAMGMVGTSGSQVESYKPNGTRNWVTNGLVFTASADIDPSSETDIYTHDKHFKMDYAKTVPGSEWSYKGYTLNGYKYPEDYRMQSNFPTSSLIRNINGKKIQFISDMYGSGLGVYKFNYATDGEIAIPCGFFTSTAVGAGWPNGHDQSKEWYWQDNNNDGKFQVNEYDYNNIIDQPYTLAWWVDKNGGVWKGIRNNGVRYFPLQGFDAYGTPIYSYATSIKYALPAGTNGVKRIFYDEKNDALYLGGFSDAIPDVGDTWWCMGSTLCKYSNWLKGNRTPTWTLATPFTPQNGDAENSKAFYVEGDYVFVAMARGGKIYVYKNSDKSLVGSISPGPETNYQSGWTDINLAITAFKRSNGEYLILAEENGYCKVMMYRWCPSGNCAVTGLNDVNIEEENSILFPNPAQSVIHIKGGENSNIDIFNAFGVNVLSTENKSNLNISALRFFTVYGPWSRPDMALLKFAEKIIDDAPIDIYNNGDMRRDFTYIGDIVDGFVEFGCATGDGRELPCTVAGLTALTTDQIH